jgi:hypothetical protein
MHIENIKSTQSIYKNSIVNTEYTTLIDDKTHKRYIEVTVHEVMLYDRKGVTNTHNNKHSVDLYI